MVERLSHDALLEILRQTCEKDTSADPKGWSHLNPLWGHCAVASLVVQNIFGGKLLRVSLENTPFEFMRSHYFNELPDKSSIDFTQEQFGTRYPKDLIPAKRPRSLVLAHQETRNRYKKLALRVARVVSRNNPLFEDEKYQACFEGALDSLCQKLWVGCILVRDHKVISQGQNKPIKELEHVCEPKCIRFQIQSRTESMVGACAHAEEYVIWDAVRMGVPLHECDIYVAMVGTDGLPRFRKDSRVGYTCLRCATSMRLAGIKNVYIDIADHWEKVGIDEALQSALQYAQGEKKL